MARSSFGWEAEERCARRSRLHARVGAAVIVVASSRSSGCRYAKQHTSIVAAFVDLYFKQFAEAYSWAKNRIQYLEIEEQVKKEMERATEDSGPQQGEVKD